MKNKIFFSIITCTYNADEYLKNNVQSVEQQTFKNYEHLFIDAFSKDKTVSIIKNYQKRDIRAKLSQSKAKGIANAMNLGIKHAKGKYLIHLHADDLFHDKSVLSDVHNFLSLHPQYDWIYGQISVFKNSTSLGYVFPGFKPFQLSWGYLLKFVDFIPHQAVFIKKSVFGKFGGFDEFNPSAMDYDLWLRIRNVTKWKYYNRVISNFRIHSGSKSTGLENFENHIKTRNGVQRRYANLFEYALIWLLNRWNDRGYKKRIS